MFKMIVKCFEKEGRTLLCRNVKKKKEKEKNKLHLMRHFTVLGKNRLPSSSDLSFDLHSAILCDFGPGHLTSLSVVSLSSIARVPCQGSLPSNLPLFSDLRNVLEECTFSIARDSLCPLNADFFFFNIHISNF